MKSWIPSVTWNPVSDGLCSNSEFLADMKRADDPSMPGWCKLPISGELGLKNQGRNAASNERKVFAHFQDRFLVRYEPSFASCLQRTAAAATADKRAKKAASCSDAGSSVSFASMLSGSSTPAQPQPRQVNSVRASLCFSPGRPSTGFLSLCIVQPQDRSSAALSQASQSSQLLASMLSGPTPPLQAQHPPVDGAPKTPSRSQVMPPPIAPT